MRVVIEWERMERRRAALDVPDESTAAEITELAVVEAARGRAGKMDDILVDAIGHVSWKAPDGRFGGRVQ